MDGFALAINRAFGSLRNGCRIAILLIALVFVMVATSGSVAHESALRAHGFDITPTNTDQSAVRSISTVATDSLGRYDYDLLGEDGDLVAPVAVSPPETAVFRTRDDLAKVRLTRKVQPLVYDAAHLSRETRNGMATNTRACSFAGPTLVLMADGTKKPIDEVRVGDEVLAQDPKTSEKSARKVTHLWVHDDEYVRLEVGDGTVLTTANHPFWDDTDQRWERADELNVGDMVLTADGRRVKVGHLQSAAGHGAAYNLTVEGLHTYHVLVGHEAVLVHNDCGGLVANDGFNGEDASSPALRHNPWSPDNVAARSADNQALYGGEATAGSAGFGPNSLVSEVMPSRLGSITQAPLPPGSPGWNTVRGMTLGQVEAGAQANLPGFDTIWKLLTDSRFSK